MEEVSYRDSGISTSVLPTITDAERLKAVKYAIDEEIGQIRMSILFRNPDKPYIRSIAISMAQKKRKLGLLSLQIQNRLAELKQDKHDSFANCFVERCRQLNPKLYRRLREELLNG